jgi:hypothetical protein
MKKAKCTHCGVEMEQVHTDNYEVYCKKPECKEAFYAKALGWEEMSWFKRFLNRAGKVDQCGEYSHEFIEGSNNCCKCGYWLKKK